MNFFIFLNQLLQIGQNIFLIYIFLDYLKRNYPNIFNYFFIHIYINYIYIYSNIELFIKKNKTVLSCIQTYKLIFDKKSDNTLIMNICQYNINSGIYIEPYYNEKDVYFNTYNFKEIIYILIDNEKKNNVVSIYPDIKMSYKISKFKFILFELKIENKWYKLDFKTENYNYYIENNIINFVFLLYFLNNHFILYKTNNNLNLNKNEKINIKFLDHNMEQKEMDISHNQYIIIRENDYKIVNIFN